MPLGQRAPQELPPLRGESEAGLGATKYAVEAGWHAAQQMIEAQAKAYGHKFVAYARRAERFFGCKKSIPSNEDDLPSTSFSTEEPTKGIVLLNIAIFIRGLEECDRTKIEKRGFDNWLRGGVKRESMASRRSPTTGSEYMRGGSTTLAA